MITGNALEVIPKLYYKFDLLFLDLAKEHYLQYLKLSQDTNVIKKNAVVIADNDGISKNEMLDYLKYVRESGSTNARLLKLY